MVRVSLYVSFFVSILRVTYSRSAYAEQAARGDTRRVRALRSHVWLIVTWNNAPSVESLRWHHENLALTPFFAGATFVVPYATHSHNASVTAKEATALAGVRILYADPCTNSSEGHLEEASKTFGWCKHMAIAAALSDRRRDEGYSTDLGYLVMADDSVIVDFPKLASEILRKGQSVAFCKREQVAFELFNPSPKPFWLWGVSNTNRGAGCAAAIRDLPLEWSSRYSAAVGSPSALPNKPPCTVDFFYIGPNAASSWCEVAGLFKMANDEACLGAMLALASTSSANVTWLPQPWDLSNITQDLMIGDSSASFSQHHVHKEDASFKAQLESADIAGKMLQYIENTPDIILAPYLNPSIKIVHDWMTEHYQNNLAKWWAKEQNPPKLVFIHIPKTGGESVEAALKIQKDHRTAFTRNFCKPASAKLRAPRTVWFTIVRNPYSHLLSWFKFCIHGWRGHIPTPQDINLCDSVDSWAAKISTEHNLLSLSAIRESFNHWILATKKVFDEQNAKDHGNSCDRGHLYHVWGTYETWLKDQNGNLLVDAVIKFEDIFEKKLYKSIAEALDVSTGVLFPLNHPANSPLTHENSESILNSRNPLVNRAIDSAHWPTRNWFNNHTAEVIARHFKNDLLWLGY